MEVFLPIIDSSEQPDTARGKKMASTKMAEAEKTIIIAVFAGLIIVAGWTGYASILGFNGRIELTNTANYTLAILSALAVATMTFGTVVIRKK